MEDRYLFKGKTCNGDWVQGFLHCKDNKWYISNKAGAPFAYEVRPDTICQCTGLKDKNGNLIWENDIVKDLFSVLCAPIKYGGYQSCFDSTKVEHIGFYVDWFGRYSKRYRKDLGYWINMVDAEIVGNVFDNPELLESEG
mgnify:CR=1 FL=1